MDLYAIIFGLFIGFGIFCALIGSLLLYFIMNAGLKRRQQKMEEDLIDQIRRINVLERQLSDLMDVHVKGRDARQNESETAVMQIAFEPVASEAVKSNDVAEIIATDNDIIITEQETENKPSPPAFDSPSEEQISFKEEPVENRVEQESRPATPGLMSKAILWITKGNPILKIGAIVLFLGLAFLLRYVSQHTYFPIELRYAAVALAALILTAVGWFVRHKNAHYGLILQGLGVGVFYLTTFAAIKMHPLLPPQFGFIILVVVTAAAILLALLQNAMPLALAASLGGFAAPVLASSGGGSHIALFSYFVLLDIAILVIAWFKAWRPLNLVGFIGTFSIGLAWAMKGYDPSLYFSTQLFLIFFFLLFIAVALLFARRRLLESISTGGNVLQGLAEAARQTHYVDGSLFFGVPIIGFGLQYTLTKDFAFGPAYSALILGLFYIALAFGVLKRGQGTLQLLFETCLALGLIFASLAVPLGFDAEWTSAIWAVEAAGIYWLSLRQNRLLSRLFSLLLLAATFFSWLGTFYAGGETVLGASKLGGVLLAGSLLFSWWQAHRVDPSRLQAFEKPVSAGLSIMAVVVIGLLPSVFFMHDNATMATTILATILLVLALKENEIVMAASACFFHVFAGFIMMTGISAFALYAHFLPAFVLSLSLLVSAAMLFGRDMKTNPVVKGLEIAVLIYMVMASGFTIVETLDYGSVGLPVVHGMLAMSLVAIAVWAVLAFILRWRLLANLALLLAPYSFALLFLSFGHLFFLYMGVGYYGNFYNYQPFAYWGWLLWPLAVVMHGVLLAILADLGDSRILRIAHIGGAFLITLLISLVFGGMLIDTVGEFNAWRWLGWAMGPVIYLLAVSFTDKSWPMDMDEKAYNLIAATPIATVTLLWLWFANIINDGSAAPISYMPVFNPLDLGLLASLVTLMVWTWRYALGVIIGRAVAASLYGATGFAVLTAMILRSVHHASGVFWNFSDLMYSNVAQTALSIVWAMVALAAMLIGYKKGWRILWISGAILSGIVVVKLLAIDLGNSGTMERIISFIGVGILMLIVGYFAPLPPKDADKSELPFLKEDN